MNGRRLLERSGQVFYNVGLVLLGYTVGAALESSFAAWSLGRQLERSLQFSARGEVARSAPPPGGVIGRLEIPRLGLNTVIIEGAEASALRCAAGHIPGTALPGSPGNVGIAGHRDQSFRRLKDAQTGDWIMVVTPEGSFHYRVASLSVASPRQTSVLAASKEPKLTLVTCYPFHYVGRAPQRFIVEAREVAPVPEAHRRARSRPSSAVAQPLIAWPWLTTRPLVRLDISMIPLSHEGRRSPGSSPGALRTRSRISAAVATAITTPASAASS